MTLITAIQTRVDGQKFWLRLLPHGLDGLLGVEVEDAIAIYEMVRCKIIFRAKRSEHRLKRRDGRSLGDDLGRTQLVEGPKA